VVKHGVTGLLFRLGDVMDLTAKTLEAAASAELRSFIGSHAREAVKAHSLDLAVSRYLDEFRALVRS
jgi:glycosyltransferase involved in cell wall biosynthesis